MPDARKCMSSCFPVLLLFAAVWIAGCATRFSPQLVHQAIVRQTGTEPEGVVELTLGRPTLSLIRNAIGSQGDGTLPLNGLRAFELAVYEMPNSERFDVTQMMVRGWEPVVRTKKRDSSAMVLIQSSDMAIHDLVVLAAGERSVVYGRLKGSLNPKLPEALGRSFDVEGPEALKDALLSIGTNPLTP